MNAALHAIVSGRVQMVMYRDFAQRKARGLNIVGTVQNLPDGTVEVVAEGAKETLEKYVRLLHAGPLLAHVEDVAVRWQEPTGDFQGFSIRYT